MEKAKFLKNDNGFVCQSCGHNVPPLIYSSRDHCPRCLKSLHIDIFPGDRANSCMGIMLPISVTPNNKKGYIITYKCEKCGQIHNNKSAIDDDFETILSVMNSSYKL